MYLIVLIFLEQRQNDAFWPSHANSSINGEMLNKTFALQNDN